MALRLLVTGASGFLGRTLCRQAATSWEVSLGYHDHEPDTRFGVAYRFDVSDRAAVARVFAAARPDAVIHAAVTSREEKLDQVVVHGSEAVARTAAERGVLLVHVSSDMVFDGERAPYDEDWPPSPITPYGRAKAEAEARVARAHPGAVIARTSLLYSLRPPDPRLARVLEDLEAGRPVTFFTDERRCPAEVGDVAAALLGAARRVSTLPPVLHLCGPETLSRWDFGVGCLEVLGVPSSAVRSQTVAESGMRRPRDLTLVARRTPRDLRSQIRPWAAVAAASFEGERPEDR